MSDKRPTVCFIDSNIWLYAFIDGDEPGKTAIAAQLINGSAPIVSTQVINEVCVNLIRKATYTEQQIQKLIASYYIKYQVVSLNQAILDTASKLRERYSLSYWDSIILSTALDSEATTLYSEDMQDGLVVNGQLKIVNPL